MKNLLKKILSKKVLSDSSLAADPMLYNEYRYILKTLGLEDKNEK